MNSAHVLGDVSSVSAIGFELTMLDSIPTTPLATCVRFKAIEDVTNAQRSLNSLKDSRI